jgi:hypothetical protein
MWVGDTRYQAMVDPYDDLHTTVGFLNAVLEAEGASTRVAVPTMFPFLLVFGKGDGLRALHDEGLLPLELDGHGDPL